jgi:hypothetical protein
MLMGLVIGLLAGGVLGSTGTLVAFDRGEVTDAGPRSSITVPDARRATPDDPALDVDGMTIAGCGALGSPESIRRCFEEGWGRGVSSDGTEP